MVTICTRAYFNLHTVMTDKTQSLTSYPEVNMPLTIQYVTVKGGAL